MRAKKKKNDDAAAGFVVYFLNFFDDVKVKGRRFELLSSNFDDGRDLDKRRQIWSFLHAQVLIVSNTFPPTFQVLDGVRSLCVLKYSRRLSINLFPREKIGLWSGKLAFGAEGSRYTRTHLPALDSNGHTVLSGEATRFVQNEKTMTCLLGRFIGKFLDLL